MGNAGQRYPRHRRAGLRRHLIRENCLHNGLLPIVLAAGAADAFEQRVVVNGASPFTVDLEIAERITGPGGPDIAFDLPAAERMRLLEGLDDIGLTLEHADEIAGWEGKLPLTSRGCRAPRTTGP